MGPRNDGIAPGTGVFRPDAEPRLEESWRRPIGAGYSSISVVGDRAFTMDADGREAAVLAFRVRDGHQLWRFPTGTAERSYDLNPLSTPTVDHGRVFALDVRGKLHVLDAEAGRLIWSRDLKDFAASPPSYGFSTAPLIENGLVIVLAGGEKSHNLVAFDKATGETAWSVYHAKQGSYSSPVAGTLGGRRQIVVPAGDKLYAVDGSSGSLLWAHEGLPYPDRNPVLLPGDRIFMPVEEAGVMLRLAGEGRTRRLEESWRVDHLKDSYSPAVFSGGFLYGFDHNFLTCLDTASGEARWRQQLSGGSLILVDDHLLVLGQISGKLHLVAASPEGYRERARAQVFEAGQSSFAPPSFAAGRIFLRSSEEMAAYAVVH